VVGDKGYRAASRRDSHPHIRRLKNYRRLATRHDTSVGNFGTLWVIGFIIMWANV